MLNWIKRWIFERNRMTFRFFDGRKSRKVDPLEVWLKLKTDEELDIPSHLPFLIEQEDIPGESDNEMLESGHMEAWAIAGRATGRAFDLPDGSLSLLERRQLLMTFLMYVHMVKKKVNLLPISLPLTVRQQLDSWTTKPDSASTSTPPEPKPATPAV